MYILLGKGTTPRQDLFFVYIICCCLLDRHFITNSKYIINSLFGLPEHPIFDISQSLCVAGLFSTCFRQLPHTREASQACVGKNNTTNSNAKLKLKVVPSSFTELVVLGMFQFRLAALLSQIQVVMCLIQS